MEEADIALQRLTVGRLNNSTKKERSDLLSGDSLLIGFNQSLSNHTVNEVSGKRNVSGSWNTEDGTGLKVELRVSI